MYCSTRTLVDILEPKAAVAAGLRELIRVTDQWEASAARRRELVIELNAAGVNQATIGRAANTSREWVNRTAHKARKAQEATP